MVAALGAVSSCFPGVGYDDSSRPDRRATSHRAEYTNGPEPGRAAGGGPPAPSPSVNRGRTPATASFRNTPPAASGSHGRGRRGESGQSFRFITGGNNSDFGPV